MDNGNKNTFLESFMYIGSNKILIETRTGVDASTKGVYYIFRYIFGE